MKGHEIEKATLVQGLLPNNCIIVNRRVQRSEVIEQAFIYLTYCFHDLTTMDYVNEPNHDEINLVRLLRRLEKSVANNDEWTPSVVQPSEEVWLQAQKTSQVSLFILYPYFQSEYMLPESEICPKVDQNH